MKRFKGWVVKAAIILGPYVKAWVAKKLLAPKSSTGRL
jgi:hypothetical protein